MLSPFAGTQTGLLYGEVFREESDGENVSKSTAEQEGASSMPRGMIPQLPVSPNSNRRLSLARAQAASCGC